MAARIGTIVERQGSAVIEEPSSIGVELAIVRTIATIMVVEEMQHIVVKLKVAIRTASMELIVAKLAFATTRIIVADLP